MGNSKRRARQRGAGRDALRMAWIYGSLLEGLLLEVGDEVLAARVESLIMAMEASLEDEPGMPLPQLSLSRILLRLRVLQEDPACSDCLADEADRLAHQLKKMTLRNGTKRRRTRSGGAALVSGRREGVDPSTG